MSLGLALRLSTLSKGVGAFAFTYGGQPFTFNGIAFTFGAPQ